MAQKVFPTKSNLINTKRSLELTRTGWEFLDKKRNILAREMLETIEKAKDIQKEIGSIYKDAFDAMQKASISLGVFGDMTLSVPVDNSIEVDYRSVMGIEIPTVKIDKTEPEPFYGLNYTCSSLDEAYIRFNEVKYLIARLAEIENSVYRLADAIKKTQKRANALQNIMIPRFEETIKYITEVLDEKEREDFSRLKVVKGQKTNEN
ncbi:MAG: V-type ATP synthase subunit D [Clostridia bacterium]|nr:V-type ATP synthase subunit D [Clostridia bacterium]